MARHENSFYSRKELDKLHFKSIGRNVLISRYTRFYGAEAMAFGNNIRVDDFCIFSGAITLGSHIHIAAFCALYGKYGVEINDFSGLSPRCTIFSATDDFSGEYLMGPMVPAKYTKPECGKVVIKKYAQVGAGSILMPNITLAEGAAVGAMSFINRDLDEWSLYVGIPGKFYKKRKKGLIRKAKTIWGHNL